MKNIVRAFLLFLLFQSTSAAPLGNSWMPDLSTPDGKVLVGAQAAVILGAAALWRNKYYSKKDNALIARLLEQLDAMNSDEAIEEILDTEGVRPTPEMIDAWKVLAQTSNKKNIVITKVYNGLFVENNLVETKVEGRTPMTQSALKSIQSQLRTRWALPMGKILAGTAGAGLLALFIAKYRASKRAFSVSERSLYD